MSEPFPFVVVVIFLVSFVGLIFIIPNYVYDWNKYTQRGKITLLCLTFLWVINFIWVPWVVYGVQSMYRANVAIINDLERAPVVLPPQEKVRPSAADGVEK
jgi:hypothetical protein